MELVMESHWCEDCQENHAFDLAERDRLRKDNAALNAGVDLVPGDYWLTSIGDGRGRAIVTTQRRLLVEQFPEHDGAPSLWADLTDIGLLRVANSWRIEPREADMSAEVDRLRTGILAVLDKYSDGEEPEDIGAREDAWRMFRDLRRVLDGAAK